MPQPKGVGDQPASGWPMNSRQRLVLDKYVGPGEEVAMRIAMALLVRDGAIHLLRMCLTG
jgi:hypothetical protein